MEIDGGWRGSRGRLPQPRFSSPVAGLVVAAAGFARMLRRAGKTRRTSGPTQYWFSRHPWAIRSSAAATSQPQAISARASLSRRRMYPPRAAVPRNALRMVRGSGTGGGAGSGPAA